MYVLLKRYSACLSIIDSARVVCEFIHTAACLAWSFSFKEHPIYSWWPKLASQVGAGVDTGLRHNNRIRRRFCGADFRV